MASETQGTRPRASIELDEARWPLVTVRFTGPCTDDEFETYLGQLSRNLARAMREGRKTALIFDATESGGANARQRKRQAEWTKANAGPSAQYSAGYAFVIPSTMVRGVLTAILWLAPMPAPHVIVATLAEALAFTEEVLRETNGGVKAARL